MRFTYLPCRSATLAFAVSLAGVLVLAVRDVGPRAAADPDLSERGGRR